jgi:hypothetical protein
VVDAEHANHALVLIDAEDNPVFAAQGTAVAVQLFA